MARAEARRRENFVSRNIFANNQAFVRQNFEHDELFEFSLLKGDENNFLFTKKNYLQRVDDGQPDLRDEEYAARIEALLEEIAPIVQNRDLSIFSAAQTKELNAIVNQDERNSREHKLKAELIFNSIILALDDLVGRARGDEGLDDWEARLERSVKEGSRDDFSNVVTFITSFYRALFYGVRNRDNSLKSQDDRVSEYQSIKSSADLRNCIGGDIGELENFYRAKKFTGQMWDEVTEVLIADLETFCIPGSQRHLRSWLEYLAFGQQSDDHGLFSPANCMAMENIRKVIGAIMLRNGNVAINFFSRELFNIIQEAKKIAQSKSAEPVEEYAYNGDFFKSATDNLQSSVYEELRNVEFAKIQEAIEIDASTGDGAKEVRDLIRKYFIEKLVDPTKERHDYLRNPRITDGINLIMHINSYAARNISVPLWLTNLACEVLSIDGPKDLTRREQNIFEDRFTSCLQQLVGEINHNLNTNFKLVLAPSNNQTDELAGKPLVELWQLDPEMPRVDGSVINEAVTQQTRQRLFQNALNAGADIKLISVLIAECRAEYLVGEFSTKGLLFHPQQLEIINLLRRNHIRLNYAEALEEAVFMGDVNYLQSASHIAGLSQDLAAVQNWCDYIQLGFTWPTLILAYNALDSNLKTRRPDLSPLPYNNDDKNNFFRRMLQSAEYCLDQNGNEIEVTALTMILLSNSDHSQIFKWLCDNISEDELCNIFSDSVNKEFSSKEECKAIAKALVADPSHRILEIMDNRFSYDENDNWRAALSLFNAELANVFLEKGQIAEFVHFAVRAADYGDLYCQEKLAEYFLSGRYVQRDPRSSLKYLDLWINNIEADDASEALACYKKGLLYLSEFPDSDPIENLHLAREFFERGRVLITELNREDPQPQFPLFLEQTQRAIDYVNTELRTQAQPLPDVEQEHAETLERGGAATPPL